MSIGKNYAYSLVYKMIAVVGPLIITPYLSRVLEADGTGVMSFVTSTATYFVTFANLGIETYGQRVIAMNRNDGAYLKKFVTEVSIMRTALTALFLGIYYVVFVGLLDDVNNSIYAIYGICILSAVFDFSWTFQGVEDFKLLAITNTIGKIAYFVATLIFVRSKNDLALASLITVACQVAPYVLCLPFLKKYLGGRVGKLNPFRHLKECLVYFIPTVAVQIYTVFDKTMIGLITQSNFENGYYEQADKIIKLPLTVITTLNIIMRSRISYCYANNEFEEISALTTKSANVAFLLAFPMAFGLCAVAPSLVPIYLGDGYEKCVTLIYVLAPLMPIIGTSNLLATHYYTPFGRQAISNVFLVVGAVLNVTLNCFLISAYRSVGAGIASVIAELVVAVLYVAFARHVFSPLKLLKSSYKYLIASVVMYVAVRAVNAFLPSTLIRLCAQILVGITVYFAVLLILGNNCVTDGLKTLTKN